jgi:monoamine oxidase
MPRFTPAGARLRRYRTARFAALSARRPIDEVDDEQESAYQNWLVGSLDQAFEGQPDEGPDARFGRRDVLRLGAVGVALGATAGIARPAAAAQPTSAPRVVVVGAGLAGLTAAYQIQRRKRWPVHIYEASQRVGGRVWTLRGTAGGQFVERGGGGINTRDTNLIRLARHLGLTPLVDTWLHYPRSTALFSFNGRTYTWPELRGGVRAIEDAAWKIWREIGYVPTHARHNHAAWVWDHRSVADLIDATAHPRTTPAGSYVAHWFGGEYGTAATHASALHYVMDSGGAYRGGGYDERYCIPGGNDVLPTTLAARLPAGAVHLDRRLTSVVRRADGTYVLTFRSPGGPTQTVVADRVVLAIAPSMLRRVDLSRAGISSRHLQQIARQPLGTAAKLNLQFLGRPWRDAGHTGDTSSDTTVQMAWSSQFQATDPATLVVLDNHQGDYDASTPAHGLASSQVLHRALRHLDQWYPTSSAVAIPGEAHLDYWPNDPFVRGTWSCYDIGGFTAYGGVESRREGNLHFAGETTAPFVEHSTMCGAVTSGMRAAREVTSY